MPITTANTVLNMLHEVLREENSAEQQTP